jgi:DNA-binding NarL/FixJ family response regulator
MGPFVALFGAADRYAAELDSLLGVGDPDATYATALELERRSNATLHEAHTLASWSHHARRAGDTTRAASLAKRARGLAEPRGMSRVMLRLERPTLVARQGSRGPDGLTGRETEVLRLLAEGCSNRDLARRLVISENTAANHVRNILIKTGCTNRTQAAMYASERGLLA